MPRSSTTVKDNPFIDDGPKSKSDLRREALNGVAQIAQFGCLAFGQFADAGAIGVFGPAMVEETVKLADNNSKIASKVDWLIEVGPYAGIVAAAIPFAAQILVNHNVFKAEQFASAGVVSPEILDTQMKTQMLLRAQEEMRKQAAAEEELRQMQEEMASHVNGNAE
jgi:hypothetical protein